MQTNLLKISGLCLLGSTLGLAACALDDGADSAEEPAGEFSKLMLVTDGANAVEVTVSSNVEAYLDRFDDSSFEIEPIFERPVDVAAVGDPAEPAAATETPIIEGVFFDEIHASLEEGAIGYSLRYVGPVALTNLPCSGADKAVFTSSLNWVTAENVGAVCTDIKISTRRYSFSNYAQQEYDSNFCAGEVLTGGRDPSNRVKLQYCLPANITYTFFN